MTTTNQDTIQFDEVMIIDDGTLDTVVLYDGQEFRYSSEFRYSFDDDAAFLQVALQDIQEEIAQDEIAQVNDYGYYYDGTTIHITRKNFAQISKDYKTMTKGHERMLHYDETTGGTISVPVKFTKED